MGRNVIKNLSYLIYFCILIFGFNNCSGGYKSLSSTNEIQSSEIWTVPPIILTSEPTSTFDLKTTLPRSIINAGITGIFAVESGTSLPAGLTLSADGIISVNSGAYTADTTDVIFTYTE